jgi:RNA polymerase sigma factor (sigma-70 family)
LDFSKDSDYDLLEMMSWKDSDPADAKGAWGAFYQCHAKYLYNILLRAIKGLAREETAAEILQETFIRVFEKGAASFKATKESNPDKIRGHVRVWLGKIAKNLMNDTFQGKNLDEIHFTLEEWQEQPGAERPNYSPRNEALYELLETELTDRESSILRVYYMYYDPREPLKKLPRNVLQNIADQFDLTPENIRQIKSRAIKKIKKAQERMEAEGVSEIN